MLCSLSIMPLNTRTKKTFAILAAIPVALVGLWLLLFIANRGPLAGQTTHDFGAVTVFGRPVELQHTFHLTNRTRRAITVNGAKPDCGCVAAHVGTTTILPGASFDLPVTLTLYNHAKNVPITLDLGDDGIQILRVKANARNGPRLTAKENEIMFRPDNSGELTLQLDQYETDTMPAAPSITAPRGVTATFGGWVLFTKSRNVEVAPNQWRGDVKLRLGAASPAAQLPDDASLRIELPPGPSITVPIRSH